MSESQLEDAPEIGQVNPVLDSPERLFGWKQALATLACQIGGSTIAGVLAGVGVGVMAASTGRSPAALLAEFNPVILLLTVIGGTAAAFYYMVKRTSSWSAEETRQAFGLLPCGPRAAVIAGLLGLGLAGSFELVYWWIDPIELSAPLGPLSTMAQSSPGGAWTWAILALLIAPVAEEIIFRGALLRGFSHSAGPTVGLLLMSAIFVALHAGETQAFPPSVLFIWSLALITGLFRQRTGSLLPGVACHFSYNLLVVIMALGFVSLPETSAEKVVRHYQEGHYQQALEVCDQLLERDPSSVKLSLLRADCLKKNGQPELAIAELLAAKKLDSSNASIWNTLAYHEAESGLYEIALEHSQKSLDLKANDAAAIDTYAYILVGLGRYEDSILHYDRAVELSPAPNAVYHLGRARAYEGMEMLEEAAADRKLAAKLEPEATLSWTKPREHSH